MLKLKKLFPKRNDLVIKDYKTPAKEIINESSLQFLLRPIKSEHLLVQVIWTIFLLILMFTTIFLCVQSVQSYLEFETITSIYEIAEKETQFPTISICSSTIKSFNVTILDLRFNGLILTSDWQNHITKYTDTYFGDCYRFNGGFNMTKGTIPVKNLNKGERNDGFILDYYLDPRRDFGSMVVHIHNYTMTPGTINNKGYYISASVRNSFIVKKKIDIKLEYPYNDCYKNVSNSLFNKTLIDYIQSKKRVYTQDECNDLCINLLFNETNNCDLDPPYWNISSNDLEVTIETIFNTHKWPESKKPCIDKFMDEFNKKDICTKYCPLECDSYTYDIIESVQPILGSGNLSSNFAYPQFETFKNFTKIFFSINVYFSNLKYTLITQQPKYEIFDLISSIGGILGLFLGISFISFLEIFEVFIEFIYVYFK